MIEAKVEEVIQKSEEAASLYHRLVLLVGPARSGKSTVLRQVSQEIEAPLLNLNLELARQMLDLTARQRTLWLPRLFGEIVKAAGGSLILLDNTEILFDVRLKHDPLRLLQMLSRNKTIIASWNGAIVHNHLTYADVDHVEYRRYPIDRFLVVTLT